MRGSHFLSKGTNKISIPRYLTNYKFQPKCKLNIHYSILEHLLVGIKFTAMQQMFLVHDGVWHLAYCALARFIRANIS